MPEYIDGHEHDVSFAFGNPTCPVFSQPPYREPKKPRGPLSPKFYFMAGCLTTIALAYLLGYMR